MDPDAAQLWPHRTRAAEGVELREGVWGATNLPEEGVPAAPNVPTRLLWQLSQCQDAHPQSDICLDPSRAGEMGPGSPLISALGVSASCLPPTTLASQNYSPTHMLSQAVHQGCS